MAYSVEEKLKVVLAVGEGMSRAQAAAAFGVSEGSVKRWLQRHRAGESLEARPRSGAPPTLKSQHLAVLRAEVEARPGQTLQQLADALEDRTGKRVALITISRALAKLGLRKVRAPTKLVEGRAASGTARYRPQHRREPKPGRYPSSLTEHEWRLLSPVFEPDTPRGRGRPRVHGVRELLDAVFYVIRTGCGWRYLPGDFPPWQTVYAAFRGWSRNGDFERMHAVLAREWRVRQGRAPEPTAAIIDSQTAKTTEKGGLEVSTARSESRAGSATSS